MKISKIEVSFARPVDLTDGEMYTIHNIVDDACRRTETPEFVHWAAGTGCKPNWSHTDCIALGMTPTKDSPLSGEPTWDDSVYYIETATRERYASVILVQISTLKAQIISALFACERYNRGVGLSNGP